MKRFTDPVIVAALTFALACGVTPAAAAKAGRAPPPKNAGWCETAGAAAAGVGALVASIAPITSTAGIAVLPHSSSAAILASVGAGGTGYVAGTLGGVATMLGVATAPATIATAAAVGVVGAGILAYCYSRGSKPRPVAPQSRRGKSNSD